MTKVSLGNTLEQILSEDMATGKSGFVDQIEF